MLVNYYPVEFERAPTLEEFPSVKYGVQQSPPSAIDSNVPETKSEDLQNSYVLSHSFACSPHLIASSWVGRPFQQSTTSDNTLLSRFDKWWKVGPRSPVHCFLSFQLFLTNVAAAAITWYLLWNFMVSSSRKDMFGLSRTSSCLIARTTRTLSAFRRRTAAFRFRSKCVPSSSEAMLKVFQFSRFSSHLIRNCFLGSSTSEQLCSPSTVVDISWSQYDFFCFGGPCFLNGYEFNDVVHCGISWTHLTYRIW